MRMKKIVENRTLKGAAAEFLAFQAGAENP